jgi:hypothetical protein
MRVYARLRGLRRPVLTLPFLPVGLMALGVDRLTPVPARIAAPLIDGMRSDSVVRDEAAGAAFPGIHPGGYREAVLEALGRLSPDGIEARLEIRPKRIKIIKHEGFLIDERKIVLEAAPEEVYRTFIQLGGKQGWLFINGLWQLRGWVDRLLGGPGMRGRDRPVDLRPGDVVDFYRVEAVEPGRLLRLRSELKAPGAGWMEWRAAPSGVESTRFTQTAFFAPRGVPGFLYWYLLYPVHAFVFAGLFKRLVRRACGDFEPAGKEAGIFEKD